MSDINFSLPKNLQYVLNNSAVYQDSCRFAFDQFVILTQLVSQVAGWISWLVLGIFVMFGLLIYKVWQVESKVRELAGGVQERSGKKPVEPPKQ